MRLAHVREQHAATGTPFRLAAALDDEGHAWLDLEPARVSQIRARRADPHSRRRTDRDDVERPALVDAGGEMIERRDDRQAARRPGAKPTM